MPAPKSQLICPLLWSKSKSDLPYVLFSTSLTFFCWWICDYLNHTVKLTIKFMLFDFNYFLIIYIFWFFLGKCFEKLRLILSFWNRRYVFYLVILLHALKKILEWMEKWLTMQLKNPRKYNRINYKKMYSFKTIGARCLDFQWNTRAIPQSVRRKQMCNRLGSSRGPHIILNLNNHKWCSVLRFNVCVLLILCPCMHVCLVFLR